MNSRAIFYFSSIACFGLVACQNKDQAQTNAPNEVHQSSSDKGSSPEKNTLKPGLSSGMDTSQFTQALAAVNAQSPEDYPAIVTPLPESKDFERIETAELMKMLESWNPSLRTQAAQALSERGSEVLGVLKEGTTSENWMIRAGSATALAAIIKQQFDGLSREALEEVKNKHADVTASFITLISDPRLEVRVAALGGLNTIAPQNPEAAMAVLKLCDDPDDYLSQDAMITLDKRFSIDALEKDVVIEAFRSALKRELPRGKGHIVRIITRMKPETQKKFVPDLIAHLDWKPMRDTMFGQGGQAESIQLLTKMKKTEVVERLPQLMGKFERGGGLFAQCLKSAKAFGKDAKVILPELKAILADCKKNGSKAKIRPTRDVETNLKDLEQLIKYLENL